LLVTADRGIPYWPWMIVRRSIQLVDDLYQLEAAGASILYPAKIIYRVVTMAGESAPTHNPPAVQNRFFAVATAEQTAHQGPAIASSSW